MPDGLATPSVSVRSNEGDVSNHAFDRAGLWHPVLVVRSERDEVTRSEVHRRRQRVTVRPEIRADVTIIADLDQFTVAGCALLRIGRTPVDLAVVERVIVVLAFHRTVVEMEAQRCAFELRV